jgi:hypothetical protein
LTNSQLADEADQVRQGQSKLSPEDYLIIPQVPRFPEFRPLSLEDQDIIRDFLWKYQPRTSELTFTNLFIWRSRYEWHWAVDKEWLILQSTKDAKNPFFLQPIGPGPRVEIVLKILRWLKEEKDIAEGRVERADKRLLAEITGASVFQVEPSREHFDYVYRSEDLISLRGMKYHAKRNYINRFESGTDYQLVHLSGENLEQCAEFEERWCGFRRCEEDLNLSGEWEAIRQALAHYQRLKVEGEAIMIDGRVEAFTFGELLNAETAVIHIEKANPEIPGLYPLINQKYCEKYWKKVSYINREQDLGEEGLRKAKLSYHPDHLEEKHKIRLIE